MEKQKASLNTAPPSSEGTLHLSQVLAQLNVKALTHHQKIILENIENQKDCIAVLPTGSGKSLCYTLPVLTLNRSAIVISPLISLMHDQIRQLQALGIPAIAFDYLQTDAERSQSLHSLNRKKAQLIFVSPERFSNPKFLDTLCQKQLCLIAVDEAHCVTKWGYQFRHTYRKLGPSLARFNKIPKLALTATASVETRTQIVESLGLKAPKEIVVSPLRSNLILSAKKCDNVKSQMQHIYEAIAQTQGRCIVYAPTQKAVTEITFSLKQRGLQVRHYHGSCDAYHRKKVLREFVSGDIQVVVATSAFGMGINLKDIRTVIHAGVCRDMEAYLQEIGRAGRDGNVSQCPTFYTSRDVAIVRYMIEKNFPEFTLVCDVFQNAVQTIKNTPQLSEIQLLNSLKDSCAAKIKDIKNALALLQREGVIEVWTPSDDPSMNTVELGAENRSKDAFWDDYPLHRKRAIENFSTMLNALAAQELEPAVADYFGIQL